MYSYHNRIKQRIRNGELLTHYRADNYPGIGEALVLVFTTVPMLRPVRPYRWPEYAKILEDWRDGKYDPGRAQGDGPGNDNPGDSGAGPGL